MTKLKPCPFCKEIPVSYGYPGVGGDEKFHCPTDGCPAENAYVTKEVWQIRADDWQPKENFEEVGMGIGWLTTPKGFADTTALLYFMSEPDKFHENIGWYWEDTGEYIKRQEFILGMKEWPNPPTENE